jgi:hypothetical protein
MQQHGIESSAGGDLPEGEKSDFFDGFFRRDKDRFISRGERASPCDSIRGPAAPPDSTAPSVSDSQDFRIFHTSGNGVFRADTSINRRSTGPLGSFFPFKEVSIPNINYCVRGIRE